MNRAFRQKFLRIGNIVSINQYFVELEGLSNKKGGGYKELYQSDLGYFIGGFKRGGLELLCKALTSKTPFYDGSCVTRKTELQQIYKNLLNKKKNWSDEIRRFIEFILCCQIFYGSNTKELMKMEEIYNITKEIYKDEDYSKEVYDILNKLIGNNTGVKNIMEIHQKVSGGIENSKEKLKELIGNYGYGIVYLANMLRTIKEKIIPQT